MSERASYMPSDEEIRDAWFTVAPFLRHSTHAILDTEPIDALIASAVEKALAEQEARHAAEVTTLKEEIRQRDYRLAEQEARLKRLLPMARFGMKCFDEHRDQLGDLDGCDLQEWAESFGLLREVHVTEPCGESCRCAEWDDFPQECLRETDDVVALRAELAALDAGGEAKP